MLRTICKASHQLSSATPEGTALTHLLQAQDCSNFSTEICTAMCQKGMKVKEVERARKADPILTHIWILAAKHHTCLRNAVRNDRSPDTFSAWRVTLPECCFSSQSQSIVIATKCQNQEVNTWEKLSKLVWQGCKNKQCYALKKNVSFYQKNKTLVFKPPPSNFSSTVTVELCWDIDLMKKPTPFHATPVLVCFLYKFWHNWVLLSIEIRWNHSPKHYIEN